MEAQKNNKKGFVTKKIRYKSNEEYKQLKDSLNENDKETALDILFEIHRRGDL